MRKEDRPVAVFIGIMVALALILVVVITTRNALLINYNNSLSLIQCQASQVGWLYQNSQYCSVVILEHYHPEDRSWLSNLAVWSCDGDSASVNQSVVAANQTILCYLRDNVLVLNLEPINWTELCVIVLPLGVAMFILMFWCYIRRSQSTVTCWLSWNCPSWLTGGLKKTPEIKLVDQATQSLLDDYIDADEDRNWRSQRLNELEVTYRTHNGDSESSSQTRSNQKV